MPANVICTICVWVGLELYNTNRNIVDIGWNMQIVDISVGLV